VIENLKTQAFYFNEQFKKFEARFDNEDDEFYYLISTKWLQQWKLYVSYNEFVSGQPPAPTIGSPINCTINDDLLLPEAPRCPFKIPIAIWNVWTRTDL
jgi:ubiquitin carboxyl-terminal hydrolase 4/11/15